LKISSPTTLCFLSAASCNVMNNSTFCAQFYMLLSCILTTCQKRDLCQKSLISFNQSESSKIDRNGITKTIAVALSSDQSQELGKHT
jgi:hypothetical protein